ncbi:MAG: hypothetical protein MRK02_00690 [Candidatus Scalindua sp.]|nr:hypothetical protein [Candidatus Scalindua sp.]
MKQRQNYEYYYDDIYPALLKKQPSFRKRFLSVIYNSWLSFLRKVCHQEKSNPDEQQSHKK